MILRLIRKARKQTSLFVQKANESLTGSGNPLDIKSAGSRKDDPLTEKKADVKMSDHFEDVETINEEGELRKTKIKKKRSQLSDLKGLEYMNMGYYIIIPILLGVFGGLALDSWLKTKPTFTLILLGLGTMASFYNLIKTLKQ